MGISLISVITHIIVFVLQLDKLYESCKNKSGSLTIFYLVTSILMFIVVILSVLLWLGIIKFS